MPRRALSHPPARARTIQTPMAAQALGSPKVLTRILRIHDAFQRQGPGTRITCASLAAQLEVSTKTVARTIDLYRDLGATVEYDPSKATYSCTEPLNTLPLLRLSGDEVLALAVAREAMGAWSGGPLGQIIQSALQKLAVFVSGTMTLPLHVVDEAMFRPEDAAGARETHHLADLVRAIRERWVIQFLYEAPAKPGPEPRRVHPLHLAFLDGVWGLHSYDPARADFRRFLLRRMSRLEVTPERFEPPANHDPRAYVAANPGHFSGGQLRTVRLAVSAAAAQYLAERPLHRTQRLQRRADGTAEVEVDVTHDMDVQRWALSWGADVEILAPPDFRARVASVVQTVAARYETPSSPPAAEPVGRVVEA